MKYVITIKEIDQRPVDWTTQSAWPGPGIYSVKGDDSLYHVCSYTVNYVGDGSGFMAEPFTDPGESVSESLLLKAIAAASHAKVLTQ